MPVSEAPEQRQSRRAAVRTICRLSTALASPEKLGKDVGGQLLAERVVQLRQVLEGEELQLLEDTVQQYESAVGRALNFSDELNKARGPHVAVSRNRSHFYVYCTKVGTLWSFTNYWPFVDYEVQPHWLMGWWATGKLTNEQYKGYLRRCKRSYRTLLQNFESVVQAEKAAQLTEYREAVAQVLSLARLPFRCVDDPFVANLSRLSRLVSAYDQMRLFPNLQAFLDQFHWATDRYKIYALQGHSQAAKTSFVKSLFAKPFVVTIQGQDVLNLQAFEYGHHDALILDNLVDWSLILQYRALLQANVDLHRLGESATGIYAYSVFLWAVPICITLDADVNCVLGDELAELKRRRAELRADNRDLAKQEKNLKKRRARLLQAGDVNVGCMQEGMDVAHVVARFVLQAMTESILRLDQLKMLSMWKAPAHPRPVANDEGAGVSARMYGCAAGWMMQRAELARKQACTLQMEQLQVMSLTTRAEAGRCRKGNISHLAKRQASILGRMWSRRSSEDECHGRNSQFSYTGQSDSATVSYRIFCAAALVA
ncbi:unnamed protein product [Symbiodinium natans]|uniref:Uncharacterized protein n=1 Tax=Symbiodinium natans TaxID=878477 RepID=A0A812TXC7_9DINO|nr:unnamed protein product [Symbiodinium natans]